jgi:uncharacterized ferritin-like protein (DUF455 family)
MSHTSPIDTKLKSLELRDFALQILTSTNLADKLEPPELLTDENPGSIVLIDLPSRPTHMEFKRHTKEEKLPTFKDHHSEENRAVCLHRFCGHELLAVEMMAYALLAFPDAPKAFRKGVAHTLMEEQEHVRLYQKRLQEMGLEFGDLPLYKHFWKHIPYLQTPAQYLAALSLTFEMANLDFAPLYRDSFLRHGDHESSKLMQRIVDDEIGHVSFGIGWLSKMNTEKKDPFEFYLESLPPLLSAKRAKGFVYQKELRAKARVPESWIDQLKSY